ncbi:hypothetical protein, partial [Chryseobacterium sp. CH1]|uniref:hypothetical protein n=1 Tax=Chryseobacterium sp. CH1 TaxID=713551 RepID=UPI001E5DC467
YGGAVSALRLCEAGKKCYYLRWVLTGKSQEFPIVPCCRKKNSNVKKTLMSRLSLLAADTVALYLPCVFVKPEKSAIT